MEDLKQLGREQTQIFLSITKHSSEAVIKINNNEAFMPVVAEMLCFVQEGEIWSIAHYGKQNGDMMADPEMRFLKTRSERIIPFSYRNDYSHSYEEPADLMDYPYDPTITDHKKQEELVKFANAWLININSQQKIYNS
jgi:hypothetical protein